MSSSLPIRAGDRPRTTPTDPLVLEPDEPTGPPEAFLIERLVRASHAFARPA